MCYNPTSQKGADTMPKKERTERVKFMQAAYYRRYKKRLDRQNKRWAKKNKQRVVEIKRAYAERNHDLVVFRAIRNSARRRGIDFLLSFEEWQSIWKRSRRAHKRGRHLDEYCMARFGDKGPYAVGNVRIIKHKRNAKEQTKRNPHHDASGRFTRLLNL
jgi:hypothetical protein